MQQVVNGVVQALSNVWVQLVNNSTLVAYVSNAVTTGTGSFTVTGIPAGTYTLNVSSVSSNGPWTSTGNANYYIGADVGSANTFTASQSISGGSLTLLDVNSKIIPGSTQLSIRNHADNADNLKITDGGVVTISNGIVISSGGAAITGNSTVTGTLAVTSQIAGTDFKANGGVGSFSSPGRYLGVLASAGPPTSGTYNAGDFGMDVNGATFFCASSGTPGTWVCASHGLYHAEVFLNTSQSIPGTSTATIVGYDTIESDPMSWFNTTTHQLTPTLLGRYHVSAGISFSSGLANSNTYVSVYINGAEAKRFTQLNTTFFGIAGSGTIRYTTLNQAIDIRTLQNTGNSSSLLTGSALTYAAFHYLGPL